MTPKELAADPLVFCYPQGRASCQTRQRPALFTDHPGVAHDLVTVFTNMSRQLNDRCALTDSKNG